MKIYTRYIYIYIFSVQLNLLTSIFIEIRNPAIPSKLLKTYQRVQRINIRGFCLKYKDLILLRLIRLKDQIRLKDVC